MIFFDIDTHVDFMVPGGSLYVEGADSIHQAIKTLLDAATEKGITTISSLCAHDPDDPEFKEFPPHCIEGTPGADSLYPDLPALPLRDIACDAPAEQNGHLTPATHYVVKKKVIDPFASAWLDGLRRDGVFQHEECIVFGVATDYCVRAAALGLAAGGARVQVVEDAIRGVAPETTATTLAEWRQAGIELTTTQEVLKRLSTTES